MKENKVVKSKILRIIFIILGTISLVLGTISLVLGTIGIFLPILPTVPFYLLTMFLYVRSSTKFANWFLNSKLYKKHMENFVNHKVMIIYSELLLLSFVSAMLLTSLWFINNLTMSIIFTLLIFFKYLYFILKIMPISKKEYLKIKEEDKKKMMEVNND